MIRLLLILSSLCLAQALHSQCDTSYDKNQSPKIANYDIEVYLDHNAKTATCHQSLTWKNTSPDTLSELRFYMYMNSFKDLNTSYLRNSDGKVFGRDLSQRTADQWGSIDITTLKDEEGNDLTMSMAYIQPNDGNIHDHSILSIPLENPILPGESHTYDIDFITKMPQTIARSGYSRHDFFLFVHWFPQVCVYEQDKDGFWGWNSHQFLPGTEFFADFGDYNVTIDASDHLTIGASGCRIAESYQNGRKISTFKAHDLIDFGFVVYSDYEVYSSTYRGVDIEILMPPEHCAFVERYHEAVTHGLAYMMDHVGPYPYPKITVVDPPVHALNSGFMEYPMMITAASFYGIPQGIRTVESLVVHEFVHMYFMATLASNEKEEAWLDEGFVTYYEDRITDHYHGDKTSLFDILGFKSGNAENSRLEYTRLNHDRLGPIAKPGWEIQGPYKGLIYAKTSSMLRTLEGLIGIENMDNLIQRYYEVHKFTHPKEEDFRAVAHETLSGLPLEFDLDLFFDQTLHGTGIADFEVIDFSSQYENGAFASSINIRQNGELILPVDILVEYEDDSSEILKWNGKGKTKTFSTTSTSAIKAVTIDPQQKIDLDINFINNSLSKKLSYAPVVKYSTKSGFWIETLLHLSTMFF